MYKKIGAMLAFLSIFHMVEGSAQIASRPKPLVQRLRVLLLTDATLPALNRMTERFHQQQKDWAASMRWPTMRLIRFSRLEKIIPVNASQKSRMQGGIILSMLALALTGIAYRKSARNWKSRAGCAMSMLFICMATYDFARALVIANEIERLERRGLQTVNQYLAVLAGLNVPFDLLSLSEQELQLSHLVARDTLQYQLMILACSPNLLTESARLAVRAAARDYGIQMLSAPDHAPCDRRQLIELLTQSSSGVVRPAMGGTMALRMDDPGAPVKAYSDDYHHAGLSAATWRQVVSILEKQQAAMSIFYVPAWVDDGDTTRGVLEYEGKIVAPRIPGKIYNSKSVVYTAHENAVRMDQVAEYEILKTAGATLDIESHAHTHLEIDLQRWLQAADKYSNKAWYRELYHLHDGRDLTAEESYLVLQNSLDKITAWFAQAPTAIVPPGHKISTNTLQIAGKVGFRLLTMNTVFLLDSTHYVEASQVRNPNFEHWQDFDTTLIADGFPTVGYLHDRDIALQGSAWFARCLRGWQGIGIRRFVTFRELAGLLHAKITAHADEHCISGWVDVSGTGGVGDDAHSRYFAEHGFPLQITLPAGRRAGRVVINDSTLAGFNALSSRDIALQLPPFRNTSRQKFAVHLE